MALTINTQIKNDVDNYLLNANSVKGTLVAVSTEEEKNALLNEVTIIKGSMCTLNGTLYICEINNNIKSWVEFSGGGTWSNITQKPFETLGSTVKSNNGALEVNTTDEAEPDNTLPITSNGVHEIVGNIETLLEAI